MIVSTSTPMSKRSGRWRRCRGCRPSPPAVRARRGAGRRCAPRARRTAPTTTSAPAAATMASAGRRQDARARRARSGARRRSRARAASRCRSSSPANDSKAGNRPRLVRMIAATPRLRRHRDLLDHRALRSGRWSRTPPCPRRGRRPPQQQAAQACARAAASGAAPGPPLPARAAPTICTPVAHARWRTPGTARGSTSGRSRSPAPPAPPTARPSRTRRTRAASPPPEATPHRRPRTTPSPRRSRRRTAPRAPPPRQCPPTTLAKPDDVDVHRPRRRARRHRCGCPPAPGRRRDSRGAPPVLGSNSCSLALTSAPEKSLATSRPRMPALRMFSRTPGEPPLPSARSSPAGTSPLASPSSTAST